MGEINTPNHAIFEGLSSEDFTYWDSPNTNEAKCKYIVENAFNKPVSGDLNILLQCGEGDFGWGGLLWSPLVEYRLGLGGLILSQLNIKGFFRELPTAAVVLKNMIKHALEYKLKSRYKLLLAGDKGSKTASFIKDLGIQYEILKKFEPESLLPDSILILNFDFVREEDINKINSFVKAGGRGENCLL